MFTLICIHGSGCPSISNKVSPLRIMKADIYTVMITPPLFPSFFLDPKSNPSTAQLPTTPPYEWQRSNTSRSLWTSLVKAFRTATVSSGRP